MAAEFTAEDFKEQAVGEFTAEDFQGSAGADEFTAADFGGGSGDSLAQQAGYLGGALVTGVKRALRDVDVIQRNREGADVPSPGDRARARAATLADPSRIRGRVDTAGPTVGGLLDLSRAPDGASAANPMNGALSFAGGESQFGMPAKLEEATRAKSTERAATEFDIATQSADLAARPKSQTMQDWERIGENDWWSLAKAVASNPVEIIGTISLESLPASLTGLAGGAGGVGAASFASEYAGTLVSEAGAQGYDFTKPEDVARFFNNPDAVRKANQVAQTRGATVGAIDAITAGLAGRFMGPALGRGTGPVLRALGAETGMQMVGGAGGEALASGLSGQPITVKNVLSEAVAELASAPGEVVSNLREDAGARALTPVRAEAPVVHAAPDPDSDLVVPGQEPAADAKPRASVEAGEMDTSGVTAPEVQLPAAQPADDTWMDAANLPAQGVVPVNEPTEGETVEQFLGRRSQMRRVLERATSLGMEGVDVRWAPELTDPQGRPVAGWVEPATGRVVLNAAAPVHQSEATSLPVLREEGAHALLASPSGRSSVRAFAISRLTAEDVSRLAASGYTQQAGENETDYRDRLADEAIAKAAREQLPWWRELVERTRVWIAKRSGGLIEVSNAEAARAILRSLKRGRGVPSRGTGVARMSLEDETKAVKSAWELGRLVGPKFNNSLKEFERAVRLYEADFPPFYDEPGDPRAMAWEAGLLGKDEPKWVRAERIGEVTGPTSTNFRDQHREKGVSVLWIEGNAAASDGTFQTFNDGRRYIVEGWQHYALGSDGEPLLSGARIAKDQTPLGQSQGTKNVPRLSIDDPQPRRFGEQVQQAADVSGEVKGRLGNLLYTPRANEPDAAFASRIVDQVGPVPAMDVFRDRANGLPGAVRGMLAQLIVKRLAESEHAAATPAEQTAIADQAARFLDQDVFEATTEAGQFIQSFAAFAALTPRGMLQVYRRTVDRSVEGARRRLAGVLRQLFGELADLNTAAVQELGRDRAAQRATTAAVNDAVKAAPEVNEAVRVVVAGELGSNPRIQQGVREAVSRAFAAAAPRLRAQSLWSQYLKAAVARIATERRTSSGRVMLADFTRSVASVLRAQVETQFPAGPRAKRSAAPTALEQLSTLLSNPDKAREVWTATIQALREAHPNDPRVDALAQQPAALYSPQLLAAVVREEMDRAELSLRDMVAGNYRAAGDGATLVQRIVAATGATGEVAQRLARAVDDVWREAVFRERTNLDNRIRSVRERESRLARAARSGLVVTDQLSDSEIDRAIAGALRAARTNLGSVLKQHFEARAETTRTLAQAFVQDARLPEPVATQLASQLQGRMRELLRARRLDAITRAKKAMPIAQRGRLPVDKLVDLADLGLLTEQRAWDAVREELKLPAFDPAIARDVTRRAEALRALPEGFQRDEAAIGLLDFIANQRGMSIGDLAMAFWYANALSRPITHLVNGISNLVQVGAHTAFTAAREPGAIPATLEALADGFKAGADEGLAVLKTGKVPYYRSNKLEASQPLERLLGDAAWERVLSKWKYVARALAASDMVFYKAAEGVRKDVLARAIARREGLKGEALVARTAEILGRTEGIRRAAEQRAEGEGLVGERRRRRVRELMDEVTPADLAQNARTHALEVIFNSEPYGVLGAVARGLGSILRDVPALRLVVPFVRVVANVTNEALNYVPPIGAGRAIASRAFGADLHGRSFDLTSDAGRADLFDQYAKAAVGTAAIVLLAAAGAGDDDKNGLRVHGAGPADPARRNQLRQQGWIPWSIQVGDRFVSYAETPVGLALAVVGSYLDATRYRRFEQADLADRLALIATALPRLVVQRSFLRGLSDLFSGLSTETSPRRAADKLTSAAVRTGAGFVVPGIFEQIDRVMDPRLTDTSTIQGALYAAVPFLRRAGNPTLNVLGEPVEISPLSRFTSKSTPDPLWSALAQKGAWIAKPATDGLTDEQAYDLVKVRGAILRPFLESRVPLIQRLPPDQAQRFVAQATEAATRQAKAQLGVLRRPAR